MRRDINMGWAFIGVLGVCALLYGVLLAIRETPGERPYLEILGGSFIFNYRIGDVYMGFTAVPARPIPIGSVLEVTFPDPAGGEPFLVTERIGVPDRRISLRSPSMRGVEAGKAYTVTARLLERGSDQEFWRDEFEITSSVGDEAVPDAPLTIGPGYHRPLPAGVDPQDARAVHR